MISWAQLNGFEPALHHRFIITQLESVTRGECKRLMILVPPGSAKSTYSSVLFPPWYLAQRPSTTILACSYAATLAASFGRRCRNLVDLHNIVLRYELSKDSKAADEWETSNGGRYFCTGVGSGIAGHRADLAFIDDYLGSQEDADSKQIREKQWAWYWNDFWPRLKPDASQIIIANRRHEDDLVGRLMQAEGSRWKLIRLPMLAEADDPLGRALGERLWAEWYTDEMVQTAMRVPRTWAGLYQQRPAPEEGDYFRRDWLKGYEPQDLPKELRVYAAGDFAISEEKGYNRTCFGLGGLDESGVLWIMPDIYWDYMRPDAPDKKVDKILDMCDRNKPLVTWAEKGQISKSLKPFFSARMRERGSYHYITEVTPTHNKEVRAQSFRARCSQGMVRFPKFAPWWGDAEHELLTFPGGTYDDLVDMLAHLGRGIHDMVRPQSEKPLMSEYPEAAPLLTMRWVRDVAKQEERMAARQLIDM
jgi:predicted phage terminase large subunit-like protein